jgi:hypothetical protein
MGVGTTSTTSVIVVASGEERLAANVRDEALPASAAAVLCFPAVAELTSVPSGVLAACPADEAATRSCELDKRERDPRRWPARPALFGCADTAPVLGELVVAGVVTAAAVAIVALGVGATAGELALEAFVLVEASGVGALAGGVTVGVSVEVPLPVAAREAAALPAPSPRPPFWRWLAPCRDRVGSASRDAAASCCSPD